METNCRVDLVVEELTTLHSKWSFVSLFPCDYMLCVLQRVLVCLYVHTVCLLQVRLWSFPCTILPMMPHIEHVVGTYKRCSGYAGCNVTDGYSFFHSVTIWKTIWNSWRNLINCISLCVAATLGVAATDAYSFCHSITIWKTIWNSWRNLINCMPQYHYMKNHLK
jgi:hypothetical protein